MVRVGETICPVCGGELVYYDRCRRILRTKGRQPRWIDICRLQCCNCGRVHRELPEEVIPYKQYEAEIIRGVLDGLITSETLGYEDYPTEWTMLQWVYIFKSQKFPG